ncbi:hypothetical protein NQ176_g7069 [Zarea fungicola]|uniref:Uncharacterized protein n=1 Tax=Zarea fungicola TaxID=93591 RepID=A0ACC1N018_9HYPO|nr:hypothetical protein NQ176_g7069 [Lecanicillium fungicola]
MTPQQPSLEAKKAYFEHFQTLPFSDDEEEEQKASETATAEPGLDPDGLDPRELRMRHRHRRFFRQKSPAHEIPAAVDATQNQASEPTSREEETNKDEDAAVRSRPAYGDDVVVVSSSARATPQDKPIHARFASKRQRNAMDDMLDEGFTQVIGETPVNMATKQQQRVAARLMAVHGGDGSAEATGLQGMPLPQIGGGEAAQDGFGIPFQFDGDFAAENTFWQFLNQFNPDFTA